MRTREELEQWYDEVIGRLRRMHDKATTEVEKSHIVGMEMGVIMMMAEMGRGGDREPPKDVGDGWVSHSLPDGRKFLVSPAYSMAMNELGSDRIEAALKATYACLEPPKDVADVWSETNEGIMGILKDNARFSGEVHYEAASPHHAKQVESMKEAWKKFREEREGIEYQQGVRELLENQVESLKRALVYLTMVCDTRRRYGFEPSHERIAGACDAAYKVLKDDPADIEFYRETSTGLAGEAWRIGYNQGYRDAKSGTNPPTRNPFSPDKPIKINEQTR